MFPRRIALGLRPVQRDGQGVLVELDVRTTHARYFSLGGAAPPKDEGRVVFSYVNHLRESPVVVAAAAAAARAAAAAGLVVAVAHLAALAAAARVAAVVVGAHFLVIVQTAGGPKLRARARVEACRCGPGRLRLACARGDRGAAPKRRGELKAEVSAPNYWMRC